MSITMVRSIGANFKATAGRFISGLQRKAIRKTGDSNCFVTTAIWPRGSTADVRIKDQSRTADTRI